MAAEGFARAHLLPSGGLAGRLGKGGRARILAPPGKGE